MSDCRVPMPVFSPPTQTVESFDDNDGLITTSWHGEVIDVRMTEDCDDWHVFIRFDKTGIDARTAAGLVGSTLELPITIERKEEK